TAISLTSAAARRCGDHTWRRRDMAIARKLPIGYYVYAITVDGVVRYIGKGKDLRLYCHMKEVRSRLNRDYRLQNIGSRLQQNLTKAVLSGAKVIDSPEVVNRMYDAWWKSMILQATLWVQPYPRGRFLGLIKSATKRRRVRSLGTSGPVDDFRGKHLALREQDYRNVAPYF